MNNTPEWVKLTVNIHKNRKLQYLRSLPNGDSMALLWLCFISYAGYCNDGGRIYFTTKIPFSSKLLANEFGLKESVVTEALKIFQELEMIFIEDGFIYLINWNRYQNAEAMKKVAEKRENSKNRSKNYRKRQKLKKEDSENQNIDDSDEDEFECDDEERHANRHATVTQKSVTRHATVTHRHATEKEEEKEKKKKNAESEEDEEEDYREYASKEAEILQLYNSCCPSLPSARVISSSSVKAVKELFQSYTKDEIREYFLLCEKLPFLKGEGKTGWVATFDWIVDRDNMAGVLNGKYNNWKKPAGDKEGDRERKKEKCGSFDTDDFFEAALRHSDRLFEEEQAKKQTGNNFNAV